MSAAGGQSFQGPIVPALAGTVTWRLDGGDTDILAIPDATQGVFQTDLWVTPQTRQRTRSARLVPDRADDGLHCRQL